MKKLIATAFVAALSLVSVMAGDMMTDCVMMKDGKMMIMKDGKSMMMDKTMTMTNGTKVMADGKVMMADGKTAMMKDGEMISMEGKMMSPEKPERPGQDGIVGFRNDSNKCGPVSFVETGLLFRPDHHLVSHPGGQSRVAWR